MIGLLKKIIILFLLPIINAIALIIIRVLYFSKNRSFTKGKEKKCIGVISDYLPVGLLLKSPLLDDCDVVLIVTKRYNYIELLKKINIVKFIIFQNDYADNKRNALLKKCRHIGIDFVLLQAGDFMVPMTNFLNRELNNKGNSELASLCSLDKMRMRKKLNEHGVSELRAEHISRVTDLDKVNYFPCVLKPNIGTHSEGVFLANSKQELQSYFKDSLVKRRKTEFETSFIVEEFIEGRQFDIEGIIHNGTMHVLCMVEENYEGFFPEFDMNWYLFNAILDNKIKSKMLDVVTNALQVAEFKHGAFHCELRIDKHYKINILEFSNRMGGGFESTILESTGNDFINIYVETMLNDTISIRKNKNTKILEKYFKTSREFREWCEFLNINNIDFSKKELMSHGSNKNTFYVKVVTDNVDNILLINKNFKLGIKKDN
jgi:hypothetical protein